MRLRPDPEGRNAGPSRRSDPVKAGLGPASQPGAPAKSVQTVSPAPAGLSSDRDFFSTGTSPWIPRPWLAFALLAIWVFVCYAPCLNGQFVWDDDAWTLRLQKLF